MNQSIKNTQIRYKKALGQNFIFDKNLLDAIAADAGVCAADTVLEIGVGAATLTRAIAKRAKKVVAVEIDKDLQPIISDNLHDITNVKIVFSDILKLSLSDIAILMGCDNSAATVNKQDLLNTNHDFTLGDCINNNEPPAGYYAKGKKEGSTDTAVNTSELTYDEKNGGFKVVANLPYYITTPVIFHLLESNLPIKSLTLMVQKEVALRMAAKPNTPDYGALSLAIAARAKVTITRNISRNMFTPPPNVDSAVVKIEVLRPYNPMIAKVIKSLFAMRRKTIANNLTASFSLSKEDAAKVLSNSGIPQNARGEQLGLAQLTTLTDSLRNILGKDF